MMVIDTVEEQMSRQRNLGNLIPPGYHADHLEAKSQ
jgi:hypothetical protein